jgi:cystathionine beta-lyase/cystathionine gamma-synthase
MKNKDRFSSETQILHAGEKANLPSSYPEAIPIFQTSAFVLKDLDTIKSMYENPEGAYYYSRSGHPNQDSLSEVIAMAEKGEAAAVCASGMAAILAGILACVSAGDHVICADAIYGGTYTLLRDDLSRLGVQTSYVDLNDEVAVAHALRPETKLFVTEIVTNPFVSVIDLEKVVAIAHKAGAKVLVDNTFTTPIHINPLEWGADLVAHSCTKFINGHNDVIAGAVVGSAELVKKVKHYIVSMGSVISPFDAWLVLRGIKTMNLRVPRQSENAMAIAKALELHPKVSRVFYPGLKSSPYHEIASKVLKDGYGAMMSFYLPDDREKVNRFMNSLDIIRFVTTLGGVRTTMSHPNTTSHVGLEQAVKDKMGIHDGLIRLSVGIEKAEDLIQDLTNALEVI